MAYCTHTAELFMPKLAGWPRLFGGCSSGQGSGTSVPIHESLAAARWVQHPGVLHFSISLKLMLLAHSSSHP